MSITLSKNKLDFVKLAIAFYDFHEEMKKETSCNTVLIIAKFNSIYSIKMKTFIKIVKFGGTVKPLLIPKLSGLEKDVEFPFPDNKISERLKGFNGYEKTIEKLRNEFLPGIDIYKDKETFEPIVFENKQNDHTLMNIDLKFIQKEYDRLRVVGFRAGQSPEGEEIFVSLGKEYRFKLDKDGNPIELNVTKQKDKGEEKVMNDFDIDFATLTDKQKNQIIESLKQQIEGGDTSFVDTLIKTAGNVSLQNTPLGQLFNEYMHPQQQGYANNPTKPDPMFYRGRGIINQNWVDNLLTPIYNTIIDGMDKGTIDDFCRNRYKLKLSDIETIANTLIIKLQSRNQSDIDKANLEKLYLTLAKTKAASIPYFNRLGSFTLPFGYRNFIVLEHMETKEIYLVEDTFNFKDYCIKENQIDSVFKNVVFPNQAFTLNQQQTILFIKMIINAMKSMALLNFGYQTGYNYVPNTYGGFSNFS